ncbi:MAG: hypothetical protein Q4B86_04870 [Eubacteriales bacterium]|nr:hypothetical protein [Eubacteriales bacterium]
MVKQNDGYTLDNNGVPIVFNDFIWKTGDDKLLVSSDTMNLTFPDGTTADARDYLEVEYPEDGIVSLANDENAYMLLAKGSDLSVSGGTALNMSERSILTNAGVSLGFDEIYLEDSNNISVTPSLNSQPKVPVFDITVQDGKDGQAGDVGADGESGEIGEDGSEGTKGEDGKVGTDGAEGSQGSDGSSGSKGSSGATGSTGGTGAQVVDQFLQRRSFSLTTF